jgi:aspartyl-tRNA(Asn)/glutamyl-tRNA(Gln) amidotransferase subunit A
MSTHLPADPMATRSFAQYAAELRSGTLSALSVVETYLERIRQLNPKIDAISVLDDARALAAAKSIDSLLHAGQDPGPLAGLPILVKDLYQVNGLTMTAGSRLDVQKIAPCDEGPIITSLRQAGCIILGKTRTTEFAMGGFNLTHPLPWNPCDLQIKRMTGGSSHGSAVSMAAGMCAFSLGSDTGGSVRQPAAFVGVVGFKASPEYWPTAGVFPMSPGLDSLGLFTKTVADAHWVVSNLPFVRNPSISGIDIPAKSLKFGLPSHHIFDHCDSESKQTFEQALERLRAAGLRVEGIEIPEVAEMDAVFGGMVPTDVLAFIGRDQFLAAEKILDPVVWARTQAAFDLKATDYIAIQRKFKDICQKVNKRLAGFDGWICPTIPQVAPPVKGYDSPEKIADWNGINTANTRPGNLFGQCGISLPMRGVLTGLPLGFQIMAAPMTDDRLLRTAITVERLLGQGS